MRSITRRLRALAIMSEVFRTDRRGAFTAGRPQSRPATSTEWADVVSLADELAVAPALWAALGDERHRVPPSSAETLRRRHVGNTARNLRFRRSLAEIVGALNEAGVAPLLFKGSGWLAAHGLARPGDRWMADLDIVVPADHRAAAVSALCVLGYHPDPGRPFKHPHELPFFRDRTSGPVELHVELGSPTISSILPIATAWEASHEIVFAGGRARELSASHQVLHNVLHAAVQDLNHAVGGLPLRQLLALSELVREHGAALDWEWIDSCLSDHRLREVLRCHLWLTHRFAGLALPKMGDTGRARRHEALVLAGFGLGWPPHLARNLIYAFGREYLDAIYAHGNRPVPLAVARLRHGLALASRDPRGVISAALDARA